jgi:hypothetical protein
VHPGCLQKATSAALEADGGALWLALPDGQGDQPFIQEVGHMTVRGCDNKKLFSKHQSPPTRNLPILKVTLF